MAFNFANFAGGAADQWNTERELSMRDRQVANQERESEDLRLSRQLDRTQKENQQKQEKALQEAQAVIAGNLQKVGTEVGGEPAVTGEIPALLAAPQSGESVNALPGLEDVTAGKPISPQPVPFSVGGASSAKRIYQESDALKDSAAALAQNPLTAGVAVKAMETAQQARAGEAFKMAAQQGDLTGAVRHLSGRDDVEVKRGPDGKLYAFGADGRPVGGGAATPEDFTRGMIASFSDKNFEAYGNRMDANERANNKAALDAEKARADWLYKQARLAQQGQLNDWRMEGGAGGSGSSGSSRGKAGGDYTKTVGGVLDAAFGKQGDGNIEQRSRGYVLADAIFASNPQANPAQVQAVVKQAVLNPEAVSLQADPVTGEVAAYVRGGGLAGTAKIARMDQVQQGDVLGRKDKDGNISMLQGEELQKEIDRQAKVARERWRATTENGKRIAEAAAGLSEAEKAAIRSGTGEVLDKSGNSVPVDALPQQLIDAVRDLPQPKEKKAQGLQVGGIASAEKVANMSPDEARAYVRQRDAEKRVAADARKRENAEKYPLELVARMSGAEARAVRNAEWAYLSDAQKRLLTERANF